MWLCDLQILQSYILFDHYLMAAKNIEKKKKKKTPRMESCIWSIYPYEFIY